MTAKLIQVIETTVTRGKGVEDDPCRTVNQYWSVDGKILAEYDPWGPGANVRNQNMDMEAPF